MYKPVCVKCSRRMSVKFGINVLEYLDRELTKPYKIWKADIGECPDCGIQVVYRFAGEPWAQEHHEGFEAEVETVKKAHAFGREILVEVY